MIESALSNLLEATLTTERYQLYVDVISYLESIEYDTIQDELLNFAFMSLADDEKIEKPDSLITDEMHAHLMQCLTSELRQTGIEVTDEATLKERYELAVGVASIPTYDDLAALVACTCSDDGAIDQLSEILHLVTTVSTEHWPIILDSVSPQLIARIRELSTVTINAQYDEVERVEEYLKKLRVYKEFVDKLERQLVVFSLVETNILGRPFDDYLNTGVLTDYFEGNQMDLLALEVYGMALMSVDARNDPPTAIREHVEKFLNDTPRIVKLNAEIVKVNGNFVKFFQTTTNGLTQ